jgi:N-acyl-D-aspartate/D-glutamate deacylase
MKANLVAKNGSVVTPEAMLRADVAIADGKFVTIGADETLPDGKQVIDATGPEFDPAPGEFLQDLAHKVAATPREIAERTAAALHTK